MKERRNSFDARVSIYIAPILLIINWCWLLLLNSSLRMESKKGALPSGRLFTG